MTSKQQASQLWPAQLWTSPAAVCQAQVIAYLQRQWCATVCKLCTSCSQIEARQHYAVLWLKPEKQYTRAQLDPVFEALVRKLNPQEHFFFVLESAELLTAACANSLLKSLEEPPQGYHFLLMTERPGALLPTVVSRCVISSQVASDSTGKASHSAATQALASPELSPDQQELCALLLQARFDQLKNFAAYLESAVIAEHQAPQILDMLIVQLSQLKSSEHQVTLFNTIEHFYSRLPMPGSTKIFLKSLFLRLASILDRI